MSKAQLIIETDKLSRIKTNNILHFLLSLFTVGFWIPVWIIVAISNSIERGRCEKRISNISLQNEIRESKD